MYDAKAKNHKNNPYKFPPPFFWCIKKEIHANFYYILEKIGDFILFFF